MIQKTTINNSKATLVAFFIAVISFTSSSFINSQSLKPSLEDYVEFEVTEEVPLFKGCEKANSRKDAVECFNKKMSSHIRNNFNYPEEALDNRIEGKVAISFIINESGVIKDIVAKATNDKDYERKLLETEAIRIVSKLPKFTPGKHQGKVVNVKYSLPITFKMM